jgi:hypothetical protein
LSESLFDKDSRPGMVTAGTGVYLLQQLAALISGDTPHEYVSGPALVELAVDEDKRFGSAGDAPGFCLVGRELPLDQPLEDGELQVGILKVTSGGSSIAMTSGPGSLGGFSPSSRTDD